jgi:Peptidase family M28/PDZ domain
MRKEMDMQGSRARAVHRVGTFLTAIAAIVAVARPASAQTCPDAAALTTGLKLPMAAVRFLADDALEGRLAGSAGERCAGDYIAATFRRLGLEPAGVAGTYFQSLPLASILNPHSAAGTGRNVVAVVAGADPQLRREAIVVGAHYDHLGHGGPGSLAPDQPGAIHNGADDNASGVGTMLRVAQRLAAGPAPARTVVFIAFTGEESGLLGSEYFASHFTIPADTMVAMINMDMVGRLGTGNLIINGVDTAEEWRTLLDQATAKAGVKASLSGEGYGPSDHTSFYTRDIPVLHFFTNVHADYHRPTDDWQKIDREGMEKVAAIVFDVTSNVANRRPVLTLVRGAGHPPAPEGEATRGYGAYLGSVPDFTPVERGVKLSGVSPGSPAEKAGIRAGDILIGLGEFEVTDLQAMTDALRAHKSGDEVEIRLLRDGQPVTVKVTLGSRSSG